MDTALFVLFIDCVVATWDCGSRRYINVSEKEVNYGLSRYLGDIAKEEREKLFFNARPDVMQFRATHLSHSHRTSSQLDSRCCFLLISQFALG
jgi:hypothetical protein